MPWSHMGEWWYSSTILHLGTRRRWVVSFTPRPLYVLGHRPWFTFDRRLGEPHSRSEHYGEEVNLNPARNRALTVQPVGRHYTDWAIPTLADILLKIKRNMLYRLQACLNVGHNENRENGIHFVRLQTFRTLCRARLRVRSCSSLCVLSPCTSSAPLWSRLLCFLR
jgi:hypothetical protein